MNIPFIYKLSGYLSIVIGLTATLCIYRIQYMYYGIALSFFGFIFAIMNIFLNTKYFNEQEKFPKGYLGMFLSSLPIVFMMLIIFKFKK
jgi:hypothetical protein